MCHPGLFGSGEAKESDPQTDKPPSKGEPLDEGPIDEGWELVDEETLDSVRRISHHVGDKSKMPLAEIGSGYTYTKIRDPAHAPVVTRGPNLSLNRGSDLCSMTNNELLEELVARGQDVTALYNRIEYIRSLQAVLPPVGDEPIVPSAPPAVDVDFDGKEAGEVSI